MDEIKIRSKLDVGGREKSVQEIANFKFDRNYLKASFGSQKDDWDLRFEKHTALGALKDTIINEFHYYDEDIGATRAIEICHTDFVDLENALESVEKLFWIYYERAEL